MLTQGESVSHLVVHLVSLTCNLNVLYYLAQFPNHSCQMNELLTCDLFDFPVALGLLLGRPELLLPHEERHPHRLEAAPVSAFEAVVAVGLVELCQLHVLHDPLVQGIESDKGGCWKFQANFADIG